MAAITLILWICSAVSSVVLCWLIFSGFMRAIVVPGHPLRITRGIWRAGAMTLAWLMAGLGLHFGMTASSVFRATLPSVILRWDAGNSRYGREALTELHRRAVGEWLGPEQCSRVTDIVLNSSWWRDGAPFDANEPASLWLLTMYKSYRLSSGQLTAWIQVVPPPLFTLTPMPRGPEPTPPDASSRYMLTASFGRDWVRENGIPYEIDGIQVEEILVDGLPAALNPLVGGIPDPTLKHFANLITVQFPNIEVKKTGPVDVIVRYRLDIHPGEYVGLGPFTWKTRLGD